MKNVFFFKVAAFSVAKFKKADLHGGEISVGQEINYILLWPKKENNT